MKMATPGMLRVLLYVAPLLTLLEAACRFPSTLYRNDANWRIMAPDYDREKDIPHAWRKLTLEAERIHVKYMQDNDQSTGGPDITYHCIDAMTEDDFVVMWEEAEKVYFSCIRFIMRSDNVVQLKQAPPTRSKMPKMCNDDRMVMSDAPVIHYEESPGMAGGLASQECPLGGGYVVTQWYDEQGKYGCEDGTIPPLKIENACERGEGLFFLGGSKDCPALHEKLVTGKPYFCMASWTNGDHTFMVINQNAPNGLVPCVRYPTNHGDMFTSHIFLDGVCDTTEEISKSANYRQLALRRFAADSICSDDTNACETRNTGQCDFSIAKACRRSCDSCPNPAPWASLSFPEQFQGTWEKDSFHLGKEEVQIGDRYIRIPSLGIYRTMGETVCSLKYSDQAPYGLTNEAKEYSLVQSFTNGCSHRMNILLIVNRSEGVLSFRVSKPDIVDWPLEVNEVNMKWQILKGWERWCLRAHYELPQSTPRASFRTELNGWFNLVRTIPMAPKVNCTVPEINLEEFTMKLPSGQECAGLISQESGDTLEVSYTKCKSSGEGSAESTGIGQRSTFECLAAFQGDSGRTFLITRTPHDLPNAANETFVCWVFSTGRNLGTIYWFRVSECDSNSDIYAQRGYRKELASFHFDYEPPPIEPGPVSSTSRLSTLVHVLLMAFIVNLPWMRCLFMIYTA